MHVSEVRIKLTDGRDTSHRIRAYATITIDDTFRVKDIKVIRADDGRMIVAMPNRKVADHCETCGEKNHMLARFCNECGSRLRDDRAAEDESGRPILYADVAHPVHAEGRDLINRAVLEAYVAATGAGPAARPSGLADRIAARHGEMFLSIDAA